MDCRIGRVLTSVLAIVLAVGLGGAGAAGITRAVHPAAQETFVPNPLFAVSYSLVRDVNGSSVAKGDTITLTFGPANKLYFLATSPGGDLGVIGSWKYAGKTLTITFNQNGFQRHAAFTLNLQTDQIQIPFQVFSSNKGASTWNRQSIDPVTGSYRVADAVAADTSGGLPMTTLISSAASYVAGVTGAKITAGSDFQQSIARGSAESSPSRTNVPVVRFRGKAPFTEAGAGRVDGGQLLTHTPAEVRRNFSIQDVVELASGLKLYWEKQQQVNVVLDSFDSASGSPLPLTPGPLVTDPRVHLHAKPPGIKKDDPTRKTALFIDPFEKTRYSGWNVNGKNYLPSVISLSNSYATGAAVSKLKSDGYAVQQLTDKKTSVQDILLALRSSPGVVMIETHGGADGTLATGESLGSDPTEALAGLSDLQQALGKGYGMPADVIGAVGVPTLAAPQYFVSLLPAFWTWMEGSEGLDLSHSLVFVGACYTDRSPDLRNAIKAKSYFGFHEEMFTGLVNAVGNYLIRMLYRPTVTPEEVFYNIVRIDQTGQEIYQEDAVFNGDLYVQVRRYNDKNIKSAIVGVLNGYGFDGKKMVPYLRNGWLGKGIDQDQVWWLTFAARWGQDTKQGVKNLNLCYSTYWKNGQLGGIKSPFCQAANAGYVPSKNDVDYAIYLVSGQNQGLTITPLPRFTLNDGA